MKAMGRKMMMRESVVAITASPISLVASMAACTRGFSFSCMKRKMFSRTMMASSITIPTARVNASKVMLFSEKSMARIRVNVEMIEAGIATAAIKTARKLRINSHTTRLARILPRIRCSSSEWMEALMKSEMSWTTSSFTPGGNCARKSISFARMSSATRTVFTPDWRRT